MTGRSIEQDYARLVEQLFRSRRFGVDLSLDRTARCLEALGHPERRQRLIQVGGTNGKGSTAAFVDAVLRAGGWKVGLFTSPHLSRFTERFLVGGEELSPSELLAADEQVARVAAQLGLDLTFFERITVDGIVAFAARAVDIAVLEVGLGGRLDATTAAGAEIACVTGVALDHQAHLGTTLEAIAGEKAGIFRGGQRAVIGCAGEPSAVPFLVAAAKARGVAELTVVGDEHVRQVPASLGLAGAHQRNNAACALAVIDQVEAALGITVDRQARERGLGATRLPGRLERVADEPMVVVDGAHNPGGAEVASAGFLELAQGATRRVLVVGVSSDKDTNGILLALLPGIDEVVVTRSRSERGLAAERLAACAREAAQARGQAAVHVVERPGAAIERACEIAGPTGAVLVAGSLFLVGEAREALLGERADPVTLADPLQILQSTRPPGPTER